MRGWLITNAFLHSQKFSEISLWLIEAAKKKGIELIEKTNSEVLTYMNSDLMGSDLMDSNLIDSNLMVPDLAKSYLVNSNLVNSNLVNPNLGDPDFKYNNSICYKPDFVLFWDKDVRLARYLELRGFLVFNSSNAIETCDDKSLTHLCLQSAGIKMPDTIIAPMTYSNIGYTNLDFLHIVAEKLSFPMVIKECFGSFGQQVYLVNNKQELKDKIIEIGAKPMLFQKFIKSSEGKDIRLQVVGNQVVASMYRYSDNGDFRANITNGGKMKPYEPTDMQKQLAVQCCKQIGLDFGGVDILFGKEQESIVCEVNSNAHFKNIYDCTGLNVADYIIEHIIERLS